MPKSYAGRMSLKCNTWYILCSTVLQTWSLQAGCNKKCNNYMYVLHSVPDWSWSCYHISTHRVYISDNNTGLLLIHVGRTMLIKQNGMFGGEVFMSTLWYKKKFINTTWETLSNRAIPCLYQYRFVYVIIVVEWGIIPIFDEATT